MAGLGEDQVWFQWWGEETKPFVTTSWIYNVSSNPACGKIHLLQTLVEFVTKGQALKSNRQSHVIHALVEVSTKEDTFDRVGKFHMLDTLVEMISKGQVLEIFWKLHLIHRSIELIPQCQMHKVLGQGHPVQAACEGIPKGQSLQAIWEAHLEG